MKMKYDVLESVWYGKVGIVKVNTTWDGIRWYIGVGEGLSQEDDEQHIAAYGNTFHADHFVIEEIPNIFK
jgi:hypothetical protein